MRDSTIPNELKGATFDNFFVKTTEERQMLEFVKGQAQKYLAGMTGNTLISGSTGIGKVIYRLPWPKKSMRASEKERA